jgi:RNA polymerase sigma-70 factor (ECF subfamily)
VREPEPETIRRAQAGDVDAFEAIVRQCQVGAWLFAYHLTRDRATADDVTQEAMIRAFRGIRSYRGEWKFSSWLLRIVRNCAVDAHRAARRQGRLAEGMASERRRTGASVVPSPSEDRLRIMESLHGLSPDLREPFVVIEILGHSYREASVILAVNEGTLKSRMHRARAALMRALADREAADEM